MIYFSLGLHNSESSKDQIDQHTFAAGGKNPFHFVVVQRKSFNVNSLSEVGLLQYFLQLGKLSLSPSKAPRAVCCASLL